MKQNCFYIWIALILVVWPQQSRAQVSPARIDSSLLKESVKAVLGTDQPISWKQIALSESQKKLLHNKLTMKAEPPDTLYVGAVKVNNQIHWIIPDTAPSKSEQFSYVLYVNARKEIEDVDVLKYRENYGYEIDYPFFRKQFRGKSSPQEIRFGRSIQNISGATISARSITHSVQDLMKILKIIKLSR